MVRPERRQGYNILTLKQQIQLFSLTACRWTKLTCTVLLLDHDGTSARQGGHERRRRMPQSVALSGHLVQTSEVRLHWRPLYEGRVRASRSLFPEREWRNCVISNESRRVLGDSELASHLVMNAERLKDLHDFQTEVINITRARPAAAGAYTGKNTSNSGINQWMSMQCPRQ